MLKQSRRFWLGLALLLTLVWPFCPTQAAKDDGQGPKAIYIIRHAEKPESDKDPNLTAKGVERANALVHVIPDNFVTPDFIWATANSKHSERPFETIAPLAKSLHITVENKYADAEYEKLAHELLTNQKYAGKNILVCWHHGEIPNLAKALGAKDVPEKWNSEEFDRVWVLTYTDGKVELKNLPQKALPGDSDK